MRTVQKVRQRPLDEGFRGRWDHRMQQFNEPRRVGRTSWLPPACSHHHPPPSTAPALKPHTGEMESRRSLAANAEKLRAALTA